MTNHLALFGVSSGVLNVISLIPYIRSIFKGKTKPERASWWIWLALMVISFVAQWAAGATWSLFLAGSCLLGCLIVATLSLKHGYGRFKPRDTLALIFAVGGILLWKYTGSPLAALIIVVIIDFMGNVLTWLKTWRAPYSENLLSYLVAFVAFVLGILSVGGHDLARLLFPVYVTIITALTIAEIIYRRRWRRQRIKLGRTAN